MKKFLIFIAFLVVITPLLESVRTGVVEANTIQQGVNVEGERELVFEQNDENGIIYTYTENGVDFKVVEEFVGDGAVSKIYVYDENLGDYVIDDTLVTEVTADQSEVTLTSDVSGEEMVFNVNDEIEGKDGVVELPSGVSTMAASAWFYNTTYNGSNNVKVTKWTVASVAIIVGAITKLPKAAQVVIQISAMTINLNVNKIYYTRHAYRDNNAGRNRPNVKYITHLYSNSAKTSALRTNVVSYHCTSYCTYN